MKEAKNNYNVIPDEENVIINSSRATNAQTKMVHIFRQMKEIFGRSKKDDETDEDETDDEQPDTIDLRCLGNEKCTKQRNYKKGQGPKILTPYQVLARKAIS